VKIDPRSDSIALHYTGNEAGEPAISGVPARDLTQNDVARLVLIEHGDLRGAARQAAIDKLVDGLLEGPYRKTAPASKKASSKKPAPATAPDTDPQAEPSATTPKEA
jgi:hypothetical protein